MAYDDDYRELIEGARDAVGDLLNESTPDSWLKLRVSYGEICATLKRDDKDRRDEETAQEQRVRDQHADTWRRTPQARRESLLFHALADERLTIREMPSRMNVELGSPTTRYRAVYESDLRGLVMRMFRSGHVERVAESFQGKVRYRYFRKRTLDGPIAALEHAYHSREVA